MTLLKKVAAPDSDKASPPTLSSVARNARNPGLS